MSKKKNQSTPYQAPRKSGSSSPAQPFASSTNSDNSTGWWIGLLAAFLGFVFYANTFGHDYCLDDFSAIKDNYVTKMGLKGIPTIFQTEYRYGAWNSPGSLYRPLSLAMFATEWAIAPDKPFLGHFMNVVFYALTGWLLWITWRRILADYSLIFPAMVVLIFMAHPIHTEVVANIKSRDEIVSLLCSTMALYSLWRYLERESAGWLGASVLAYGVGLFAKESGITFLAIFPLTLWYFTRKNFGEILKISVLYTIPAAVFLAIRHAVLGKQVGQESYSILDNFIIGAKTSGSKMASAFMMCWEYLSKLFLPFKLVSDQGYPQLEPVTFSNVLAVLGLVSFVGLGVWALTQLQKRHILSYGIWFFLITFSLFSNIIFTIGTSYGERLLYAPSLGFAICLSWLICRIFKVPIHREAMEDTAFPWWNPAGKGVAVWSIVAVLVLFYGVRTIVRNQAWKDSYSLYTADIPTSPRCAKLNYHYSLELAKQGLDAKGGAVVDKSMIEKAIEQYTNAIKLYPEYHDAYAGRALAYFRLQNYDKAFDDYQKALVHRPNDAKVLSNMGYIYFLRNDLAKAEEVYTKSVKLDPRFVDARRNLGAVYAMTKRFPQAIEQFQEGLKYEPNNGTLYNYIGSAYRDMGQPEKAAPFLEKARALGVGN